MKGNNTLQKTIDGLLILTLIIFPIAVHVSLVSPEDSVHPLLSLQFSIADLLIGLTALLWLIKVFAFKEIRELNTPPAPVFLLTGIGLLSLVNAFSLAGWAKDFVQWIEYFILFYFLLLNNLKSMRIHFIKNVFYIQITIMIAVAFFQHFFLNSSPYFIRGLFENRNMLGSYLCMILPLVFAGLLYERNIYQRIWFGALILLSLLVVTSGTALLAMAAGMLMISIVRGKNTLYWFLGSVVLIGVTYPVIMPLKNKSALKESYSLYEQGKISKNYNRYLALLYDVKPMPLFEKTIGENVFTITTNLFLPGMEPNIRTGNRYAEMDNKKNIKQHYLEMQAALNLMTSNTLLGVGLGNYQGNIGSHYNELPKVNTAEPNQVNGYLVIGVTTGVLGLGAFLWIMLLALKRNYANARNSSLPISQKQWRAGLLGSIVACFVENCFSLLLVTGLFVPFIFLVYSSLKEDHSYE